MITRENWPERWQDVPAGTEVCEEIYESMYDALPPIFLMRSPYCGFQMGEPFDHREDEKGAFRNRYLTFVHVGEKHYFGGIHFAGECPEIAIVKDAVKCKLCGRILSEDVTRIHNSGLPSETVLCQNCHDSCLDDGSITSCETCLEFFTPDLLQVNEENGEKEICPFCHQVWCD